MNPVPSESAPTPDSQPGPKIAARPVWLAAAYGSREEWVRLTVMPKNDASVVLTVRSPVSMLTVPGPAWVVVAPSALRSTTTCTGSAETAAPFGPVKSARSWTGPSGLTVAAAFQTRAGLFPAVSTTGQAASGVPALVTSAAGTVVQASASERRQEKATALYLAPSASAASGTRAAVRVASLGAVTPPAPTWKV